jgi:hypothetical protein
LRLTFHDINPDQYDLRCLFPSGQRFVVQLNQLLIVLCVLQQHQNIFLPAQNEPGGHTCTAL